MKDNRRKTIKQGLLFAILLAVAAIAVIVSMPDERVWAYTGHTEERSSYGTLTIKKVEKVGDTETVLSGAEFKIETTGWEHKPGETAEIVTRTTTKDTGKWVYTNE